MLQLFVYLLLAAALGFALGWLIRGGAAGAGESARDAEHRDPLERERERLARELSASERTRRDLQGVLDRMRGERAEMDGAPVADAAGEGARARLQETQADLDVAKRRIAALEGELAVRRPQESARVPVSLPVADTVPVTGAGAAQQQAEVSDGHVEAGTPPEQFEGPQGQADDLKLISGIGPSIEKMLNGLGIYHFRQIAAFTPQNVAWVDQHLRFKGRIAREDWIGQARTLAVEDVRART